MMKFGLTLASAALALVTLSSTTRAVQVNPGDNLVPAGSSVNLGSSTPLATFSSNFAGTTATGTTVFTGSFTTMVLNEGSANPLGGLTFVYDFGNAGQNTIKRLTASGFAGFTTNVNYDGTGPIVQGTNTPPITFDRSDTPSDNGNVVGFSFVSTSQPGVVAGSSSAYLVIRTNALGYTYTGSVSLIDGGTADIRAFGATAVPEPGTMVAALVGLTAIGGLRLRRRAK